ncbi:unnamed protein product, partial [Staurois parvus]
LQYNGRQYSNHNTVQYKRDRRALILGDLQSKREGLVVQTVVTVGDGLVGRVEDSIIT